VRIVADVGVPETACRRLVGQRIAGRIPQHVQYSSIEFGRRCHDAGVRLSMGSVGDAHDNAMCGLLIRGSHFSTKTRHVQISLAAE
jgi:transposase InsO family protein